ncbi:CCAPR-like protein [Mya arenaria]|uniref:CCAPR-like protein n=1 Tax=Mya arenaria TaxID=6604 RepID=A0ABY7DMZ1_MYAAR|nr:mesotocin receptor-like [Mya arenaria]WAQ98055.1 CCAPR-like protein [Mya arenaria]
MTNMSIEHYTGMEGNFTNLNLTEGQLPNSVTTSAEKPNRCGTVHDIELDKPLRLVILYSIIIVGLIGAGLVLLYLFCNRKVSPRFNRLSRVNAFILNLTFADALVILLAVLPQLIWEYNDRTWYAGPVMCRVVKYLQGFSMVASNYILIVIAIDRHQAIRAPLKESWPVWKMAGLGWLMAALCAAPMLGVFHLNEVDGQTRCENIFRTKPEWHRGLWIIYIELSVFIVPFVLICVCYIRIFLKVAQKANENTNKRTMRFKTQTGKVYLQSTQSTSLPRAKIKTLKLTFAIILAFTICSTPNFIMELIMSFGDHCLISRKLYGFFGGMAPSNSAVNPFIFLSFNVTIKWIKEVKERLVTARRRKPYRFVYSANSSMDSHPSIKHFGTGDTANASTRHTFLNA